MQVTACMSSVPRLQGRAKLQQKKIGFTGADLPDDASFSYGALHGTASAPRPRPLTFFAVHKQSGDVWKPHCSHTP